VALLTALGAAGIVLRQRSPRSAVLTLHAGPAVDISQAPGPQSEAALAVDPRNPSIAVAGSNDPRDGRMRVYATVGGNQWSSQRLAPPKVRGVCAMSDPGVAIGLHGRQYFSFLGLRCDGHKVRGASIYVSTRPSSHTQWRTSALPVSSGRRLTLADDRPAIAADLSAESPHRGRLYLTWSRFSFDPSSVFADPDEEEVNPVEVAALASHSDDEGRTWSKPDVLSTLGIPLEVRVAVSLDGEAYATWRDAKTDSIYVARAADGNSFGTPRFVAAAVVPERRSCHTFRARIPAQPKRCVSPNPVIAVDNSGGGRVGTVYIVWGTTGLNGSQDVEVAAFSRNLDPLLGIGRVQLVNPREGLPGRDQFLPTAAVDRVAGRLWSCYYETRRPGGRTARFTCTASNDGGRTWLPPVAVARAASDESRPPANVANGYGDYESAAVAGSALLATWTDGSRLSANGEEIAAARVTVQVSHP
jgi:hypothetical protein